MKFLSRGLLLGEGKGHIIYPYYLSTFKVGVQGQDFSRWGGIQLGKINSNTNSKM